MPPKKRKLDSGESTQQTPSRASADETQPAPINQAGSEKEHAEADANRASQSVAASHLRPLPREVFVTNDSKATKHLYTIMYKQRSTEETRTRDIKQLQAELYSVKTHAANLKEALASKTAELNAVGHPNKRFWESISDAPMLQGNETGMQYFGWENRVFAKIESDPGVFAGDSEKVIYVLSRISPNANVLPLANRKSQAALTYTELIRVLRSHFTVPGVTEEDHVEYYECAQNDTSIFDFVCTFQYLAHFARISEKNQIQDLRAKVCPKLRDAIADFEPDDLEDLIQKLYRVAMDMRLAPKESLDEHGPAVAK